MTYPLKLIGIYYYLKRTQRKKIGLTINDIIDLFLAIGVGAWVFFRYYLAVNDNANQFMNQDPSEYSNSQYFIFNVIWLIECDINNFGQYNDQPFYFSSLTSFRFDMMLAIVGALVWIKLFL